MPSHLMPLRISESSDMTLDKFIAEASKRYGEPRTEKSSYGGWPGDIRIPDWVRGLIEAAWAHGKKDGRRLEERFRYRK